MDAYFGNVEPAHSDPARERVLAGLPTRARDTEVPPKATGDEPKAPAVTTAKAAAQKADTVIRDHPYESMGVAFGLGLLTGVPVNRTWPPGGYK
jgi:ElaB/YqjD/DUF883 family membrane-anchored ribosome-binding protein